MNMPFLGVNELKIIHKMGRNLKLRGEKNSSWGEI